MKSITKNLVYFSIILFITTVAFRYTLSTLLQNKLFSYIWLLTVGYGVVVFIFGWIFGKRDNLTLPLYDIGFRFHLATFIICNTIAEAWYLLNFQSVYEKILWVHLTVIIWGAVILLHYILYIITRKNAIHGIKKSELFE